MLRLVATIMAVALIAGVASAELTGGWSVYKAGEGLPGFVSNRLDISTDADWTQGQLLIILEGGAEIYQEQFFGNDVTLSGPTQAMIDYSPSIEFDTYVTGNDIAASVAGGAVDVGGNPNRTFDAVGIDLAWYTDELDDTGDILLAQVTLADTAMGTWAMRLSNAAGANTVVFDNGTVVDGVIIPEPATMSLVVLGGLAMLRRRR